MYKNNKTIYLPIRALGDFVITAAVIKNRFRDKIPTILPPYLNQIFSALDSEEYFEVIGEADFFDQPAFFEFYKVKDIENLKRLFADIGKMYAIANNKNTYLLDYSSKRTSFVKAKVEWPDVDQNIYTGKFEMFSKHFETSTSLKFEKHDTLKKPSRILVLPGSRIATKRINELLVTNILNTFNKKEIVVAEFGATAIKDRITFSNFNELIGLINEYDLIISAESLPYHLAYYLNKPHFVIYNESKHFKATFMTPFMLQNKYFETFRNNNGAEIVQRLSNIIE